MAQGPNERTVFIFDFSVSARLELWWTVASLVAASGCDRQNKELGVEPPNRRKDPQCSVSVVMVT